MTIHKHKLGRLPRGHDTRIPHMAALRAGQTLPPLPASINYGSGMPADLGAMLNDSLGDCTCAAVGHAIQLWSYATKGAGGMITVPDSDIEELYEEAGGYVPGDPSTDNGCVEQTVLSDWLNGPVDGNELAAYVEINVNSVADVFRSIWECGLVYIGMNVPNYIMNSFTGAGSVWDVDPSGDNTSAGGHAVIITGYGVNGNMPFISWGEWMEMTPAFWAANVDECYALANADWIASTGNSPAGLSLTDLVALMQSLKQPHQGPDAKHSKHQHRNHKRKRHSQRDAQ
jgi:hypothetical protein